MSVCYDVRFPGLYNALAQAWLERVELGSVIGKRCEELSKGMQQKVQFIATVVSQPELVLLDEPTAGLDPVSVEILKEKILKEKDAGRLLIITSHIMSDLDELSTEVVYLQEGSVRYNNSIEELKDITGEVKLGKAMAKLITGLDRKKNTRQPLNNEHQ